MFPGKEKYFSDRRYLHSHTIPFSDKCNKTVSIKPRVLGSTAEPRHRHAANLVFFYWVQPLFSVLCFNINMFSTWIFHFVWAGHRLTQTQDVCIYTKLYFFFSFLGVVGWDDVIKHSAPGPLRVWMVWGFLVCKMDKRKTLGDNVN